MNSKLKNCEVCGVDATCLCYQCMSYFCDSCHKLHNNKEKNKDHKKENIDYFVPFDLKCPEHQLYPMGLFCIDEKGNIKLINYYYYFRTLLSFLHL